MDRRGASTPRFRRLTFAEKEERRRCVRSDGARKRAALHYKKFRSLVSTALLRRVTEEFDARIRAHRGEGSSSRAPRTLPPSMKEEELPEGHVVTEADYALDDASFDRWFEVIQQRSIAEAEAHRARRDELIDDIFHEQGLDVDRDSRGKQVQGELVRAAHKMEVIDLVSDSSSGLSDFNFSDEE